MPRTSLGPVSRLDATGRLIELVDGRSVAVFRTAQGEVVAYENVCPHVGGPVCSGKLFPMVDAKLVDGEVVEHFVEGKTVLNCPWHGWEFHLDSGICRGDARYRLRSFEVSVEEDEIVVNT